MKSRLFILASAALAACQGTRSIGVPEPTSVPPASPVMPAPIGEQEAQALPVAGPPPPALSVVVEGRCPELGVEFLDNATLVHYGHVPGDHEPGAARLVLAFLKDDGSLDEDPMLGRGLMHRMLGMVSAYPLDVRSMTGSWPDKTMLYLGGEGGERVGALYEARVWRSDHWE